MSLLDRASCVQNLPLSSVKVPIVVTIVGESVGTERRTDTVIQLTVLYIYIYIYLITRVSMQYRELLHEWAWYFHEL